MKKIIGIIFLASLVLVSGLSVAYYNTSSFGYDNANLISRGDEQIRVFDYTIEYKDINYIIKKLKSAVPDEMMPI